MAAIPGIVEAAAVAQADEHSGEVVAVFVVSKDPALTERSIIDKCRESLTGYKLPRHVYFRDELPKSNVGKILRRGVAGFVGAVIYPSELSAAFLYAVLNPGDWFAD